MANSRYEKVIQAVTTYKTLQPFVSATLLPRLISKKVWETGPLWEGFIRCAKVIAPHSFAALLLLPKEQLQDVVEKQPAMREPLREYVKQSKSSQLLVSNPRDWSKFLTLAPRRDRIEQSAVLGVAGIARRGRRRADNDRGWDASRRRYSGDGNGLDSLRCSTTNTR